MKHYDHSARRDFHGAAAGVLLTLTGMLSLVVASVLMQPIL